MASSQPAPHDSGHECVDCRRLPNSIPSQSVEPQSLPDHAGKPGRMPFRDNEQGGSDRPGGHPSPSAQPDRRWLTAKLTANGLDLCRSATTSADEHGPSTCMDGRQRTALDGGGRVRSPLLCPLSYRGRELGSGVRWLPSDGNLLLHGSRDPGSIDPGRRRSGGRASVGRRSPPAYPQSWSICCCSAVQAVSTCCRSPRMVGTAERRCRCRPGAPAGARWSGMAPTVRIILGG